MDHLVDVGGLKGVCDGDAGLEKRERNCHAALGTQPQEKPLQNLDVLESSLCRVLNG